MRMIAAALLLALALGPGVARAEEGLVIISARDGSARSLDARPTERSVVTFADVLRSAFPDLDAMGRASRFAGMGADGGPAEIDLGSGASYGLVPDGEREHVAMIAGGVLILAQTAPEFRPAGALPLQTGPAEEPTIVQTLLLGEGRPAAVVMNARQDGDESFTRHLIVTPVEGQVRQVFQGPVFHSVQTWDRGCEPRRLEERMLPVALRDAQRDGYAELSVTARVARICTQRGRSRTLGSMMHYARLRWDPAQSRYVGGLDALERRNRQGLP
jgi:hypothetical protein